MYLGNKKVENLMKHVLTKYVEFLSEFFGTTANPVTQCL